MTTISFKLIKEQFDTNLYHIGYLTYNDLIKLMNFPIKLKPTCSPITRDNIYYNKNCTGLLVIKHTLDYDYSVDKDVTNILLNLKHDISFISKIDYLPLKMAQILAGTGQYGKNQVIYDYKFGFETHVSLAIINNPIKDLPERNPPNWELLPQCKNCNDCEKACPVQAMHNNDKPPWIDWVACNMFNRYGDHANIPSMKWGWGKYILNPPLSDEQILQIQTDKDLKNLTGYDIIPSQIEIDNEMKYIQYPICRECTSQPKCSKFNGHYPYDKDRVKIY